MDKISLIKKRLTTNNKGCELINVKDHVIELIYNDISYDTVLTCSKTLLRSIKNDYFNKINDNRLTALSIDYYLMRGWDHSDAAQRIFDLQRANALKFAEKRKANPDKYSHMKSPMTVDFWVGKGYTKAEAMDRISSQRPLAESYWTSKGYSQSEAKKLTTEHQANASKSYRKKWDANPDQYDGCLDTHLAYYLNQGYDHDTAEKMLRDRQATFSLDKCIARHGETEGTRIFNERQRKWKDSLHRNFETEGDGRSPSSKFANAVIAGLCSRLKIEVPKKEKWIRDKTSGNAYSYDFTFNNKIIELNGDYWHCNPTLYDKNSINRTKKMTALEIWQYDEQKIKLAESHGYSVYVVWESDWNKDPNDVLEKCIHFLNS